MYLNSRHEKHGDPALTAVLRYFWFGVQQASNYLSPGSHNYIRLQLSCELL